jgi:hypothetical protein
MLIKLWYQLKIFLLLSTIGLSFAFWFALNQVIYINVAAIETYPIAYFLLTMATCYLTILIIFFINYGLLNLLGKQTVSTLTLVWCYIPLVGVFFSISLLAISLSIFTLQCSYLLTFKRSAIFQKSLLQDALILLFYIILHLLFTTRFSPLFWHQALLSNYGYYSEELHVLAPIFQGFLHAKQFAFSNLDHAQWAGIMNPPTTLASPLMQLLVFIFDLPSISYESFHVVLAAVYFIMAIIGTFGFYLFLKYAAKVYPIFALLGGFLFIFSGSPPLFIMFQDDGGIFFAPYIVFPYALWFISLACQKKDYFYAALAGLSLAAQFFFLAPHPEGTIYSLGFFSVYAIGLCLFEEGIFKNKLKLVGVALLSFFILSAYTLLPIFYDSLMGNMYVFAHIGDVETIKLQHVRPYILSLSITGPLSYYLLQQYKNLSPVYMSSLLLACCCLCLMFIAKSNYLMHAIIKATHIGLHFWFFWRTGMYLCLSSFIILIFSLNAILKKLFLSAVVTSNINEMFNVEPSF